MGLKHQACRDRKWRAVIRTIESHFPAALPPLLFLTDPDRTPDPVAAARSLPAGAGIIYRHFGASNRADIATALSDVAKTNQLRFLIAADPELALATDADGVHWPEASLNEARSWRGRFALQTASAHSTAAVRRAMQADLDAALVSAIFTSNSPTADDPLGPARLARLSASIELPLYGLGGLNARNAARIAEFAGIAAVEGLF